MDRFLSMQVFVAVAESKGFALAARRLAMSPPAVTRAVAALEASLGLPLLQRTTRNVRLTESGARYLVDCKRLLAELEDAEQALTGEHGELRGQLSLTASVMFGTLFVSPILLEFLQQHRRVHARSLLVDRVVDVIEESIDVAVRIARLSDSTLTAIRVGSVRELVVASPAFLKLHGTPKRPQDLTDFDVISFSNNRNAPNWSFGSGKHPLTVRPSSRLVVNSSEVAMHAAIADAGITRVLSYMAASEIKAGRLKVVLKEFEPEPLPIHVIHREGRQPAARVRAFVDFLVDGLRKNPLLKA